MKNDKLKILHIWDQAGVSCVLAKYQRKVGHEVSVIKREGFDKFGIMKFYNETMIRSKLGMFFLKTALSHAKNYDIIHVHDLFQMVPKLKSKYKNKKIILHYHGTKLRTTPVNKRENAEYLADSIIVSTPDLSKLVNSQYLPNPVDVDHFSPRIIEKNNKIISLITKFESNDKLISILKKNGIEKEFEVWPREKKPIEYADMPRFLSKYEYFIDLKLGNGDNPIPASSMTGLQALSLGMKVINFEYKITYGLPDAHKPENVIYNLEKIYDKS